MKYIIILLMLICSSGFAQFSKDIISIEFTKETRGFVDQIFITPDSVKGVVQSSRSDRANGTYQKAITADEWKTLVASLRNVSLSQIDGLQSPTKDRTTDGAIHSSIVIKLKDGNTITHGFDNENPHPDLKPLLQAINTFRPKPATVPR